MATILGFFISMLNFCLETLIKYLFLFNNLYVILKKLSNFSFVFFFNIYLRAISSYLTLGNISITSSFRDIGNKEAPRYIQYLSKDKIDFFIIFSKILYFFIHR